MLTNKHDIPLALAVWLMHDDYDYIDDPNYISATSLLKPIKQILLAPRVNTEFTTEDVSDNIAKAMGTSLHNGIETAWKEHYKTSMKLLGYPDKVIDRFIINPEPDQRNEDTIPVFVEQRHKKQIGKYLLGGKFDLVIDGCLQDTKSTSVYSYIFGSDSDYKVQGSIYKWLVPHIINEDYMYINFIFTDWQKAQSYGDNYPSSKVMQMKVDLMSLSETEAWIKNKLADIEKYKDAEQDVMPRCTDEELWRSADKYKYFSNPDNKKATKNFDSKQDAHAYMASKGKGVVVFVAGEVKRCLYCPAYSICKQKDEYFNV